MPVPPKRRPSSSKGRRQSHHALTKVALAPCPKCKKPTSPHRACAYCGYYKGREVVKRKVKAAAKAKK